MKRKSKNKLINSGHFIGKISVRAFIQNGKTKKYLVARAPNQNKYEIPGGRIELGENIEKVLEREIKEELGISLSGIKPKYVYSEMLLHGKEKSLQTLFVFKINVKNNILNDMVLNDEIKEIRWIDKKSFKDLKYFGDCSRALNSYFQ